MYKFACLHKGTPFNNVFVYLIWCLISIMSTFYIIEGDKNKQNTCELVKNVAQISPSISNHSWPQYSHYLSIIIYIFLNSILWLIEDILNHLLVYIHQWNDGTFASRSPNSIWSTSTMERWTDRKNVLYADILCVMCFFRRQFLQ